MTARRIPLFLALAAAVAVVAVAGFIGYRVLVDADDAPEVGGDAPPDTYDITVGDCVPSLLVTIPEGVTPTSSPNPAVSPITMPDGTITFAGLEGTITNTTDEVQGYTLLVHFVFPDGRREDGGNNVIDVPPGETVDWVAYRNASGPVPDDIECELQEVDSWEYD